MTIRNEEWQKIDKKMEQTLSVCTIVVAYVLIFYYFESLETKKYWKLEK